MEWDPFLTTNSNKLENILDVMDPNLHAVNVEGGLWFIMDNKRKFNEFRKRLRRVVQSLVNIRKKRKVN